MVQQTYKSQLLQKRGIQGRKKGTTELVLFTGEEYHTPDEGPELKAFGSVRGNKKNKLGGNSEFKNRLLSGELIPFTGRFFRECVSDQYKKLKEHLKTEH